MVQMDFDNLYELFSARVFRLCLSYVNDTEKAKDLMQETFISVWLHLSSFRHEADVGTWIYRIACNKCLRELEKYAKKPETELPHHIQAKTDNNSDKYDYLRHCIAGLPKLERMMMGLYLEDVAQEQIAEILGISHANVRVKIHRIKKKLVQKWKDYEQF